MSGQMDSTYPYLSNGVDHEQKMDYQEKTTINNNKYDLWTNKVVRIRIFGHI